MEDQEIIKEFLIESNENLARLDREMVELEQRPKDAQLLASVFRTIHTIKGTCGFLGFIKLQSVAHGGENLLSRLRDGELELTSPLVTLILEVVDAVKRILTSIETSGAEGTWNYEELLRRLQNACPKSASLGATESAAKPPAQVGGEAGLDPAQSPEPAVTGGDADAASGQKILAVSDSTIRVDVGLLDRLMNLVGELVLTRNQILQFNAHQDDATLNTTSQRLNLITTELQEGVMKTRMQPIGVVWNKLPRMVRDLAAQFDKQIVLEMDGADTELDRTIIEAIKDPLTHIVRNCCDHGIEKPAVRLQRGKPGAGKISLRAFHEGGQVNIEIADDGDGVNLEALKQRALQKGVIRPDQADRMTERELVSLIFLPGVSTAQQVTSVSGRGVGMDVVKTNIEKIGGAADLVSRSGEGTTVKLKIPLTLAIIPGLVVKSGAERFVIPQVSLLELLRLGNETNRSPIEWIHGTPVYRHRGRLLPVTYLNQVLRQAAESDPEVVNIVVLQAEDRQFGLIVDGIQDTQEIVVKPLSKQLKGLTCYAGATIMGDGRIALILDVLGLGQLSGVVQELREQSKIDTMVRDGASNERQTFLLFRAGPFKRLAVPLSLVARLEEVPQSKIEHAGGHRVVQYRGKILPLAPLAALLDPDTPHNCDSQDPALVVVFSNGEHGLGVMVDQILDIVQEAIVVRRAAQRPGLLGSAVIGGKVTDLLDLQAVIHNTEDILLGRPPTKGHGATVMLAEPSDFFRGLVRSSLEMAGYQVVEAGAAAAALKHFERRRIDIVAASLDLPDSGGFDFLEKVRRMPGVSGTPALALVSSEHQKLDRGTHPVEFDDYQIKFDRQGILRSIGRLSATLADGQEAPAIAAEAGQS